MLDMPSTDDSKEVSKACKYKNTPSKRVRKHFKHASTPNTQVRNHANTTSPQACKQASMQTRQARDLADCKFYLTVLTWNLVSNFYYRL